MLLQKEAAMATQGTQRRNETTYQKYFMKCRYTLTKTEQSQIQEEGKEDRDMQL